MTSYNRFIVQLTADAGGGPSNPADIDFDISPDSTATTNVQLAQLLAYVVSGGQLTGVAQRITGVRFSIAGAPAIPIGFPTAEWATLVAGNGDLGGVTMYGDPFGGGSPCPRGTSVCMTEHTDAPGRFGRGKHYLPFTKTAIVDGAGTLSSTVSAQLVDYYHKYVLTGNGPFASVALKPIVRSKFGGGTNYDIVAVQPSSLFSMLQSRKR